MKEEAAAAPTEATPAEETKEEKVRSAPNLLYLISLTHRLEGGG